jgi:hypothetical protein
MSLSNEQGAPTETRYDKPLDSEAVENEIQIGTAKVGSEAVAPAPAHANVERWELP